MMSKMAYYYRIFFAASHPTIGATFCHWRREVVFAYMAIVLLYSTVSYRLDTIAASEPAERERLGNKNSFIV